MGFVLGMVVVLIGPVLTAGIRAPRKYSGVVFCDRWDNCILLQWRASLLNGPVESVSCFRGLLENIPGFFECLSNLVCLRLRAILQKRLLQLRQQQ